MLRCREGEAEGERAAVSIRHHEVQLSGEPFGAETNGAAGTVVRQIYLGAHRDYLVALAGGTQLRASAPMELDLAPGTSIYVYLPPENCRLLAA